MFLTGVFCTVCGAQVYLYMMLRYFYIINGPAIFFQTIAFLFINYWSETKYLIAVFIFFFVSYRLAQRNIIYTTCS